MQTHFSRHFMIHKFYRISINLILYNVLLYILVSSIGGAWPVPSSILFSSWVYIVFTTFPWSSSRSWITVDCHLSSAISFMCFLLFLTLKHPLLMFSILHVCPMFRFFLCLVMFLLRFHAVFSFLCFEVFYFLFIWSCFLCIFFIIGHSVGLQFRQIKFKIGHSARLHHEVVSLLLCHLFYFVFEISLTSCVYYKIF